MIAEALTSLSIFEMLLIILIIFIGYYFLSTWQIRRKIPPGPWPLPLVGNLLSLRGTKSSQDAFWVLSRRYGNLMSFWFGNYLSVVVTGKEMIHEAFVNQKAIFCSRPESMLGDLITDDVPSIPFGKYGPVWHLQRKIANRALKKVVDSSELEQHIATDLDEVVTELLGKKGEPVDLVPYIANIVFNCICFFAYRKRYKVDDVEFKRLIYINDRVMELVIACTKYEIVPCPRLLRLHRWVPSIRELYELNKEVVEKMQKMLDERRQSKRNGEVRDFVDALLSEHEQLKKSGTKHIDEITDTHLSRVLQDFYFGGTIDTNIELCWTILCLVTHPEIQQRCHDDIKGVTGGQAPSLRHRPDLPFVEASIMEAIRLRPSAAMGFPHMSVADTKLGGYFIPEGTMAVPSTFALQTDTSEEFGPNADKYDPAAHFLDENGTTVLKPDSFFAFGGGKRVCMGEKLAKNLIFLVITGLLQRVKFCKVPGDVYTLEPDPTHDAILYTQPYRVIVEQR